MFLPSLMFKPIAEKQKSSPDGELKISKNGASVRTRTGDLRITSALLYQLSYAGLSLERTTGFEPATLSLGS